MGCPDAVRAELLKVPGVLEVTYHPDQDRFTVRFESVLVGLETIFTTVSRTGAMMGQEYVPEVMPSADAYSLEAVKVNQQSDEWKG
jgi:copper chaperone CopZ